MAHERLNLDEPGWVVVDFRTHGAFFPAKGTEATMRECLEYIAEDLTEGWRRRDPKARACAIDDLVVHEKEAMPHTVSGPQEGPDYGISNTGMSVQYGDRWIAP